EVVQRSIEVRSKVRALLVDHHASAHRPCARDPCRPPRGEAEDLITAAVGEDRLRPSDEAMKAAASRDEIVARPQIEVIGVAEQDLRAEFFEIPVRDAFDGALRADRHERRRLHVAVRRGDDTGACESGAVRNAEAEHSTLTVYRSELSS